MFLRIWYDKAINEFVLELVKKDRRGKKMKFKKILYACIMGGIV